MGSTHLQTVLRKEALYYLMTIGTIDIIEIFKQNNFNFTQWYTNILRVELLTPSSGSDGVTVLRRRVLLLCGDWLEPLTEGKQGGQIKLDIFQACVELMSDPHTPLAVSLAALTSLQNLIEEALFDDDSDDDDWSWALSVARDDQPISSSCNSRRAARSSFSSSPSTWLRWWW